MAIGFNLSMDNLVQAVVQQATQATSQSAMRDAVNASMQSITPPLPEQGPINRPVGTTGHNINTKA